MRTVVFTGDWVPVRARATGGPGPRPGHARPRVHGVLRTSAPGSSPSATSSTRSRQQTSPRPRRPTAGSGAQPPGPIRRATCPSRVAVVARSPLAWVWPNSGVRTSAAAAVGRHDLVDGSSNAGTPDCGPQDDRVLLESRPAAHLVPNRPYALPDGWDRPTSTPTVGPSSSSMSDHARAGALPVRTPCRTGTFPADASVVRHHGRGGSRGTRHPQGPAAARWCPECP